MSRRRGPPHGPQPARRPRQDDRTHVMADYMEQEAAEPVPTEGLEGLAFNDE
jgi:hypothetical protein